MSRREIDAVFFGELFEPPPERGAAVGRSDEDAADVITAEEADKAADVVDLRMGADQQIDAPCAAGHRVAQLRQQDVGFCAAVDQHDLVGWRVDEGGVALTDIKEVDAQGVAAREGREPDGGGSGGEQPRREDWGGCGGQAGANGAGAEVFGPGANRRHGHRAVDQRGVERAEIGHAARGSRPGGEALREQHEPAQWDPGERPGEGRAERVADQSDCAGRGCAEEHPGEERRGKQIGGQGGERDALEMQRDQGHCGEQSDDVDHRGVEQRAAQPAVAAEKALAERGRERGDGERAGERELERDIEQRVRRGRDHAGGGERDRVGRTRRAAEDVRGGEDDGHRGGAQDRRLGADEEAVAERGGDGQQPGRAAADQPGEAGDHDRREQGDVAAGDHDQMGKPNGVEVLAQGAIERVAAAGDHALRDAGERGRERRGEAAVHGGPRVVQCAPRCAHAAALQHAGGVGFADCGGAAALGVVAPVARARVVAQDAEAAQLHAVAARDIGRQGQANDQVAVNLDLLVGERDPLGAEADFAALPAQTGVIGDDAGDGQPLLGDGGSAEVEPLKLRVAALFGAPEACGERERREQQQHKAEPGGGLLQPQPGGADRGEQCGNAERGREPAGAELADGGAGDEGGRPEHRRSLIEAAHGGGPRRPSATNGAISASRRSVRMPASTSSRRERNGASARRSIIRCAVVAPMAGSASSSASVAWLRSTRVGASLIVGSAAAEMMIGSGGAPLRCAANTAIPLISSSAKIVAGSQSSAARIGWYRERAASSDVLVTAARYGQTRPPA